MNFMHVHNVYTSIMFIICGFKSQVSSGVQLFKSFPELMFPPIRNKTNIDDHSLCMKCNFWLFDFKIEVRKR